MKSRFEKPFVMALAVSLCLAIPAKVSAQLYANSIISGTVLTQGGTNKNTGVVAPAAESKITSALILKQLGRDEHTAGAWSNAAFPDGSKLAYDLSGGTFEVVDAKFNPLLSVSNILTLNAGPNGISTTTTTTQATTLAYDATGVGGVRKYAISGMGIFKSTQTAPNKKGNYTSTETFSFHNGTGEGINGAGRNFVVMNFSFYASAVQHLNDGSGDNGDDGINLIEAGNEVWIGGVTLTGGSPGGTSIFDPNLDPSE